MGERAMWGRARAAEAVAWCISEWSSGCRCAPAVEACARAGEHQHADDPGDDADGRGPDDGEIRLHDGSVVAEPNALINTVNFLIWLLVDRFFGWHWFLLFLSLYY